MARILVSGAAGFLGYALAERLSNDRGNEVVVVDNFVRGEDDDAYRRLCARPNVLAHELDLGDASCIEALPDGVDLVYHLAALNGTQNFYERPLEVVKCCTLPTLNLLQKYCADPQLKRFVYAGTSEAYAGTVRRFDWPVPTAEDVPLCIEDVSNPRWSYAVSKLHGEVAVANACRAADTEFVIIRYHNAYGPRMGDKHVVPDFIERMLDGRYELYGHADTRAFIYVDDAIEATTRLAEAPEAAGEVVNLGSETETQIRDLGEMLMRIHGVEGDIELHPSPKGSVSRRVPDISKLKKLTGFSESTSLEDGLRQTLAYYAAQAQRD